MSEDEIRKDNVLSKTIKLSNYFNATIALGVVTALLYAFGWNYWQGYFRYFGVECLMDLTLEETLSSSWPLFLLIIFPLVVIVVGYSKDFVVKEKYIKCPIGYLLVILLLPIITLISFYINSVTRLVMIIVMTVVVLLVPLIIFRKYKITIKGNSYIFYIIFYIALFMFLSLKAGRARAENLLDWEYKTITLTVEGEEQPPKDAILIAHTDGKYIICTKYEKGQSRPKTIVIEDSKVLKAEIDIVTKTKKQKGEKAII